MNQNENENHIDLINIKRYRTENKTLSSSTRPLRKNMTCKKC